MIYILEKYDTVEGYEFAKEYKTLRGATGHMVGGYYARSEYVKDQYGRHRYRIVAESVEKLDGKPLYRVWV